MTRHFTSRKIAYEGRAFLPLLSPSSSCTQWIASSNIWLIDFRLSALQNDIYAEEHIGGI